MIANAHQAGSASAAPSHSRSARTALLAVTAGSVLAGSLLAAPGISSAEPAATQHRPSAVRLLGQQVLPNNLQYAGTTVGGLSGIDYSPWTKKWYLQSDDRSEKQSARFYAANIPVSTTGVGPVAFTDTKPLLDPNGKPYPPISANTGTTVDPEEIRVDPLTKRLTWSQEGDRQPAADGKPSVLIQPSVRHSTTDGKYAGEVKLPANYQMHLPAERGPRQNLVTEGMTYSMFGYRLITSLEGPRYEDGPIATTEKGATSRITVFNRHLGKKGSDFRPAAEYAYQQEPLFAAPNPPGGTGDTGVPTILSDPSQPSKVLVMERSYVAGAGNKVRIFEADTRGATDIKNVNSIASKKVRPLKKKLLVDLDTLKDAAKLPKIDNVESMTWGPTLPTGERTLVLVSDNNFSDKQVTQVIALAVRP